MPRYLSGSELLWSVGAISLARLAGPEDAPELDAGILRLALEGEDLAALGHPPDRVDAAAKAVVAIHGAIDRAEAALEQALRGVYALPLSPVDDQVKGLVRDLSLYHLHRSVIPEDVAKRAELARKDLAALGRGERRLSAAGAGASYSAGMPDYRDPAGPGFSPPEGWG